MNKKLNLLIRKNQQRRMKPMIKDSIESLLGVKLEPEDFIELEESDIIVDLFYESFQKKGKRSTLLFREKDKDKLDLIIKETARRFANERGYLIFTQAEVYGLIKINMGISLLHWEKMIDFDKDSLSLLTLDKSNAIHIDYFEDCFDGDTSFFYEISEWEI